MRGQPLTDNKETTNMRWRSSSSDCGTISRSCQCQTQLLFEAFRSDERACRGDRVCSNLDTLSRLPQHNPDCNVAEHRNCASLVADYSPTCKSHHTFRCLDMLGREPMRPHNLSHTLASFQWVECFSSATPYFRSFRISHTLLRLWTFSAWPPARWSSR